MVENTPFQSDVYRFQKNVADRQKTMSMNFPLF